MADDDSKEKQFEASPEKLRKLREEGDVPVSAEFNRAVVFVGSVAILSFGGAGILSEFQRCAIGTWRGIGSQPPSSTQILGAFGDALLGSFMMLAPLFIALLALGVAAGYFQVGGLLALKRMTPRMENLNPAKWFKEVVAPRTQLQFLKSVLSFVIVTTAAWMSVRSGLGEMISLVDRSAADAAAVGAAIVMRLLIAVACAVLALGVLDIVYTRIQYAKKHRMNIEEMKRGQREDEGDPYVKAMRKSMMHGLLESNMRLTIGKKGSIAFLNPTHIAVVFKYDKDDADNERAPQLIAKGKGAQAQMIKRILSENNIPQVENIELARALYRLNLSESIPEDLFEAAQETMKFAAEIAESEGWTIDWTRDRDEEDE
ncbi:MAG: EscU/YscU/HrcU family type III secretion system export apparatus switch protein [Planctomycetes bacterium]|nr:EscU/YscU/HrcU family type III secretion system export apparatus switch protein [Planctomycetota bacterium]